MLLSFEVNGPPVFLGGVGLAHHGDSHPPRKYLFVCASVCYFGLPVFLSSEKCRDPVQCKRVSLPTFWQRLLLKTISSCQKDGESRHTQKREPPTALSAPAPSPAS